MQLIVKYFSYQTFYFWGGVLGLDKYILPWQMCVMFGVILHLGK